MRMPDAKIQLLLAPVTGRGQLLIELLLDLASLELEIWKSSVHLRLSLNCAGAILVLHFFSFVSLFQQV